MNKPGLIAVALVAVITGAVGCGAKPRQDTGVFFPNLLDVWRTDLRT